VLTYANGQGLTFTRKIAVDEHYMFTLTDTVANTGAIPVTLAPYGSVQRQGVPPDPGQSGIVHQGSIGYLDGRVRAFKYKDLSKKGVQPQEFTSTAAWTGITDKYWLAALVPNAAEQIHAVYRDAKTGDVDVYEANYTGAPRVIAPGTQVTATQRLFAGAKTVPLLKAYEKDLGIAHFDDAVDWGMFWFLTRPIFIFLEYIYAHVGTFGIAILLLTVAVRLAFFPIANKQYESMTKMKKLQPLMEDVKKRFKDDPAKQQQEIMALYQREKVNPLAGCLPILLQIPVFFSLYKVLSVTIEMRHAPFLNFTDLSARDPTTIWNLFGLIPWNPAHAPLIGSILDTTLHLGILPLCYGFTMWLTTSMSPPAGDPAQQRIFQLMPLVFMFIMAPFAVGLLIYWTWSNVLTTIQQYVMMRRFKVDNPIDRTIARLTGKAAPG
jgi:YidC/Oxa1 family membrane protein insertase